jgi:hypothetical protein
MTLEVAREVIDALRVIRKHDITILSRKVQPEILYYYPYMDLLINPVRTPPLGKSSRGLRG